MLHDLCLRYARLELYVGALLARVVGSSRVVPAFCCFGILFVLCLADGVMFIGVVILRWFFFANDIRVQEVVKIYKESNYRNFFNPFYSK